MRPLALATSTPSPRTLARYLQQWDSFVFTRPRTLTALPALPPGTRWWLSLARLPVLDPLPPVPWAASSLLQTLPALAEEAARLPIPPQGILAPVYPEWTDALPMVPPDLPVPLLLQIRPRTILESPRLVFRYRTLGYGLAYDSAPVPPSRVPRLLDRLPTLDLQLLRLDPWRLSDGSYTAFLAAEPTPQARVFQALLAVLPPQTPVALTRPLYLQACQDKGVVCDWDGCVQQGRSPEIPSFLM